MVLKQLIWKEFDLHWNETGIDTSCQAMNGTLVINGGVKIKSNVSASGCWNGLDTDVGGFFRVKNPFTIKKITMKMNAKTTSTLRASGRVGVFLSEHESGSNFIRTKDETDNGGNFGDITFTRDGNVFFDDSGNRLHVSNNEFIFIQFVARSRVQENGESATSIINISDIIVERETPTVSPIIAPGEPISKPSPTATKVGAGALILGLGALAFFTRRGGR